VLDRSGIDRFVLFSVRLSEPGDFSASRLGDLQLSATS
jgi:hypothetical protein